MKIILKNGIGIPQASDLNLGEIAIDNVVGNIYTKLADDSIIKLNNLDAVNRITDVSVVADITALLALVGVDEGDVVVVTSENKTFIHNGGVASDINDFTELLFNEKLNSVDSVADESAQLALNSFEGDIVIRSDEGISYVHNGGVAGTIADFSVLSSESVVTSVNGEIGDIQLTTSHIASIPSKDYVSAEQKAKIDSLVGVDLLTEISTSILINGTFAIADGTAIVTDNDVTFSGITQGMVSANELFVNDDALDLEAGIEGVIINHTLDTAQLVGKDHPDFPLNPSLAGLRVYTGSDSNYNIQMFAPVVVNGVFDGYRLFNSIVYPIDESFTSTDALTIMLYDGDFIDADLDASAYSAGAEVNISNLVLDGDNKLSIDFIDGGVY